ncbi:MAG: prolyl oligopeptidase family serine peptidase [Bacteroidota bacterium]
MKRVFLPLLLLTVFQSFSQNKKPLDHSVYDGWKSISERIISNDGNYIVYSVNPQEGDGELVIQNITTKYKKVIPRGNSAVISEDSRFVYFKIKPVYKETRQARIKKKKPDEMQKDSLGIVELARDSIIRIPRIKSFKLPEEGAGWVAYQFEKPLSDSSKRKQLPDSVKAKIDLLVKLADSVIRRSIDSVKGKVEREEVLLASQKAAKEILKLGKDETIFDLDAEGDDAAASGGSTEGTELVLRKTSDATEVRFKFVNEFYFDKAGTRLLLETSKNPKDTTTKAMVLLHHVISGRTDTLMQGCNDCKGYQFDETGNQVAFLAERDSSSKSLQKFYKLWYYMAGQDSATLLADKNTVGMRLGTSVSEDGTVVFSKDGKKIFFGTAAIKAPKDTTLVDFELARLDVWHYNDDYLQPQQLKQLSAEQKRNYTAVIQPGSGKLVQLGDENAESVILVDEGNADYVLASSTKGGRIAAQWTGRGTRSAYIISTLDGKRTLVNKDVLSFMQASPKGKFIYWYDPAQKNYFTYEVNTGETRNITKNLKVPLYDTENDMPDYPSAVGASGWIEDDAYFLINDEYDIWKVDPTGNEQPKNITNGYGRKNKVSLDYVILDLEKRFVNKNETVLLRGFNKLTKYAGFFTKNVIEIGDPVLLQMGPYAFNNPLKAKTADAFIVQRSNIDANELFASPDMKSMRQLTDIASQQKDYNWLTVELVKWKMFDGKMSEGMLYKPANFDPKKKYPIIFYFYERNSDNLYNYRAPAPSASIINVPLFVSNGYLVFDPNIYYKTGEPGQSAYNSVVSAAKFLAKMPFVDSTRMALQGQSWGGYQIAYLITKTNMFRAAGAGAPVANMTSAYGGIRWGAGINRQFQYEKSQSRIGATLWQRPDLYIKNSPLFEADKIKTPLLMTHNDADDAVPWYQGIEFFTALRRLNKKVWLLQYNGEAHNLIERKNRKDLSIRLSQFFDYYLKDAQPAKWIKDGLPATEKGKSWGLEVE